MTWACSLNHLPLLIQTETMRKSARHVTSLSISVPFMVLFLLEEWELVSNSPIVRPSHNIVLISIQVNFLVIYVCKCSIYLYVPLSFFFLRKCLLFPLLIAKLSHIFTLFAVSYFLFSKICTKTNVFTRECINLLFCTELVLR